MSHPREQRISVGDYGDEKLYIQLIDENGTPWDPSLFVQPITVDVIRPDQTVETLELVLSTDPDRPASPDANVDADPATNPTGWKLAGGWTRLPVRQYLVDGDSTTGPWLDMAGLWSARPICQVTSPAERAKAPVMADNQFWVEP